MSIGFGDDFKELVRANTNLVDLVSESIALTPSNANDYVGLCPFHDDKRPSFHVYSDRQSYRCWVCDKGGDCFGWVMDLNMVTFPEALKMLAERANLEMPQRHRNEFNRAATNGKVTQYEIVEWACNLMQSSFRSEAGELARQYAVERRMSADILKLFRVGFHPEEWTWLLDKAKGKFTGEQLVSVGLATPKSYGSGLRDQLVGRLVFPIIDERGRPVAFGGRVLPGSNDDKGPKYWNSPETDIFLKRKTLYGFHQARETIRKESCRTAIVVEGYMDVVACHQAGVTNVVATLGTALTEDHVRFLKRFADRVVLLYDGDAAGIKAAEKAIDRFLSHDIDLRIMTLADGQDPADYFETHTKEEFEELVKAAPEAWEYKLQSVSSRYGKDTIGGRQKIAGDLIKFLVASTGLKGTIKEDLILRNLSQRMSVEELALRQQLSQARQEESGRQRRFVRPNEQEIPPQPVRKSMKACDLAERELLEIILSEPETVNFVRYQIGPDDFEDGRYRRLYELCVDLIAEEGLLPEPQRVIAAAESSSELLSLVNALLDSAREKGISELMNEDPLEHQGDSQRLDAEIPAHLQRVLNPLILRRDRNQIVVSKQKMAQAQNASGELLSDTLETLRRITKLKRNEMGNQ